MQQIAEISPPAGHHHHHLHHYHLGHKTTFTIYKDTNNINTTSHQNYSTGGRDIFPFGYHKSGIWRLWSCHKFSNSHGVLVYTNGALYHHNCAHRAKSVKICEDGP